MQAVVEHSCKLLRRVIWRKIRPAHVADEQCVTRQHRPWLRRPFFIGDDQATTFGSVAGRLESPHEHLSDLHFKSVPKRYMRKIRAGLRSDIHLRARTFCEFFVPGNEVGMQMRFKNMPDCQPLLLGRLKVNVYVALRIDDRSFALGADHVGSMSQASQIKLLKIHFALRADERRKAVSRLPVSRDQSSRELLCK